MAISSILGQSHAAARAMAVTAAASRSMADTHGAMIPNTPSTSGAQPVVIVSV
jgi:hypothetical protein